FSLPSMGEDGVRRHIELGVKGPAELVDAAYRQFESGVRRLGGQIR
ncbi:MAG: competence/damage-inducible protein A, partial [Burkholderiales bacterium]